MQCAESLLQVIDTVPRERQALAGRSAQLESLDLSYCSRVGDAGAGALAGMSALRRLDLTWTAVTPVGLRALAAGLPGLESLQPGVTVLPQEDARPPTQAPVAVLVA